MPSKSFNFLERKAKRLWKIKRWWGHFFKKHIYVADTDNKAIKEAYQEGRLRAIKREGKIGIVEMRILDGGEKASTKISSKDSLSKGNKILPFNRGRVKF